MARKHRLEACAHAESEDAKLRAVLRQEQHMAAQHSRVRDQVFVLEGRIQLQAAQAAAWGKTP